MSRDSAFPPSPSRFLLLVLLSVSLAWLAGCDRAPEQRIEPPRHLILVSLDTFRADHLTAELTPRLAALAEESVRFADVVTAAPSTLTTHASLFTGRHPHHHGVAANGWVMSEQNVTLAEILRDAGFHTAGFVASFALLDRFAVDQGFDVWNQDFDQRVGVDIVDQNQRRADRVVDAMLAHLDTRTDSRTDARARSAVEDSERLFLFAHFFDPHYPYDPEPDPEPGSAAPPRGPELRWNELEIQRSLQVDGEVPRELAHRYAREIAFVDAQVGRLVDGLERRGLLDDALLVVTSDHGEALWQHGERWHATEVYQTTTRGVFFARPPGGVGAASGDVPTVDGAVTGATATVDVMPTVLRSLGIEPRSEMDGQAFDLHEPSNLDDPQRIRFSQATGTHRDVPPELAERPEVETWPNLLFPRAVRQGRWKLIQWPLGDRREALFDLAADPEERRNLLADPHAVPDAVPDDAPVETLRRALDRWAHSADPLPGHFDRDFELDTRRQLCALGYVECPDKE